MGLDQFARIGGERRKKLVPGEGRVSPRQFVCGHVHVDFLARQLCRYDRGPDLNARGRNLLHQP